MKTALIDHLLLLEKSEFYEVSGGALKWFSSYLIFRQQQCLSKWHLTPLSETQFIRRASAVPNLNCNWRQQKHDFNSDVVPT